MPALPEVTERLMRRVLVADDIPEVRESLALLLRTIGHEVFVAADGEEAVRMAERVRPDAVLLDLDMPRLDGFGACRRLRATLWGRDLLLVAVSAWGKFEDRRVGIESGFDFHLTKPADAQAIANLIAALGE